MNKALILAQAGKISDRDLLEAMYPNSWQEKHERMIAQNQAIGLIQEMVEVGGEGLVDVISQEIQKYKGMFENGEIVEQ